MFPLHRYDCSSVERRVSLFGEDLSGSCDATCEVDKVAAKLLPVEQGQGWDQRRRRNTVPTSHSQTPRGTVASRHRKILLLSVLDYFCKGPGQGQMSHSGMNWKLPGAESESRVMLEEARSGPWLM
jgi:hypothetical protein